MALTPADFKIRYPEFSEVDDSRVQFMLDDAALEVSETRWDTLYEKGSMALAAHLLSISQSNSEDDDSGGEEGNLTSKSIGDVSYSFAKATSESSSDDWYLSTSYGAEYLRLKKRVGMGIVAVTEVNINV
jgi:hypothetical protein